ncbi:MAG: glycosyltransferase family 4 protein [Anaerolineae bacterium]|nr:glycosyltransferase family 4 protein [Anaerolineae bacterium]
MMRLLIVSHTEHYNDRGIVKGWGPTVREIDHLAHMFDEVVHIAPLYNTPAPSSALAYQSPQVRLHVVKPAGGERFMDKFSIIAHIPAYISAMMTEIRKADIVHVRCPANISLLAVILLAVLPYPRRRWIKYAGNWQPQGHEALSYTFQRRWLSKGLTRGKVTVNGQWPRQPAHVYSFLNPCLTDEEVQQAKQLTGPKCLIQPVRLLFVGQLNAAKGVGRAIQIMAELQQRHINATLDLIGDGTERPQFEAQARDLGVVAQVTFHGWLPRAALGAHYAQAHLMLFPSGSEGWPKVLSEGMAYGVVPIAGHVSSIPQYLKQFATGRAIDPYQVAAFVEAVLWYVAHPDAWQQESNNAQKAAPFFTYSTYLKSIRTLLEL